MTTSYNPFSLVGKTILVTGASSGIGRATAIECSKMGAKLIITGRNPERLNETFLSLEGVGHKQVIADLTIPTELENLVLECDHIDGCALCSGIMALDPCLFTTPHKIRKIFDTNFFSLCELSRLLLKKKRITKGGSIIFVSSIACISVSSGNSAYGSAKSALLQWSNYLALEMKSKGIRVNCVSPGMTETPGAIVEDALSEEQYVLDKKNYIYNRYAQPSEIAHAMIYLLSDASKWVTGTNLIIDGGRSLI